MIREEWKIFYLSIIGGVAFWLLHTSIDNYIYFKKPSFQTYILIFYDERYVLLYMIICFVIFGQVLSRFIAKARKSESRYLQLFHGMVDSIFLFPPTTEFNHSKLVEANEASLKFLGYNREELLGLSPAAFVAQEKLPDLRQAMERINTDKKALFETTLVAKDGREIPVEINAHLCEYNQQPMVLCIARDLSDRKMTEEELRASHDRLRFLSSQLLNSQESERKRVSRELHDEIGQSLTLLKLKLRSIEEDLAENQEAIIAECEESLTYIDSIIDKVRRISMDLSPVVLENMGLTSALRYLLEEINKYNPMKISFDVPEMEHFIAKNHQIVIYRIFQECLTNIIRHARAGRVAITGKKQGRNVFFQVEDDGIGFNVRETLSQNFAGRGWGLTAMEERAQLMGGHLRIHSEPGKGTGITLVIPVTDLGGNDGLLLNSIGR